MNKSKVVLAVCVAGISFLAAMNSEIDSVSANAVMNSNDISQTSNIIISSEKISPYVIEFVTQQESNNITSYARFLQSQEEENFSTVKFDFTQAEFYDENGNLSKESHYTPAGIIDSIGYMVPQLMEQELGPF